MIPSLQETVHGGAFSSQTLTKTMSSQQYIQAQVSKLKGYFVICCQQQEVAATLYLSLIKGIVLPEVSALKEG